MIDSLVKSSVGNEEEHKRRYHSMNYRVCENAHVEEQIVLTRNIQLWIPQGILIAYILVKNAHRQNWEGRKEHVIRSNQNGVINGLSGVTAEERIPEMSQSEREVLVEEVSKFLFGVLFVWVGGWISYARWIKF